MKLLINYKITKIYRLCRAKICEISTLWANYNWILTTIWKITNLFDFKYKFSSLNIREKAQKRIINRLYYPLNNNVVTYLKFSKKKKKEVENKITNRVLIHVVKWNKTDLNSDNIFFFLYKIQIVYDVSIKKYK